MNRHTTSSVWVTLGALMLSGVVSAAMPNADGNAGAKIASNGGNGFPACASCHGQHGEGQAAAGFPRLTAQTSQYLARQLNAYASGARVNEVMQPIAKAMSEAQRLAVSDFYAAMTAESNSSDAAARESRTDKDRQGRSLAMVGIEDRKVQACANCHGADGTGSWPAIPALAGQHASYLKAALAEWKNGSRKTDPSGQMPRIAQALTDGEVQAVAAYYAALPTPSVPLKAPDHRWVATRTIVSGPVKQEGTPPATTAGVGIEQGASTTGGTQGVGGPPASSSDKQK